MVVNICYNTTDPEMGLMMCLDRTTLKLYMGDTGLLVTMSMMDHGLRDKDFYRNILIDSMNVNKGMFAENIVAEMLQPTTRNYSSIRERTRRTRTRS